MADRGGVCLRWWHGRGGGRGRRQHHGCNATPRTSQTLPLYSLSFTKELLHCPLSHPRPSAQRGQHLPLPSASQLAATTSFHVVGQLRPATATIKPSPRLPTSPSFSHMPRHHVSLRRSPPAAARQGTTALLWVTDMWPQLSTHLNSLLSLISLTWWSHVTYPILGSTR